MADIHFGNGQPITSLSAALTAASNGDRIISHGPHLDTVNTVTWTKNDIVWNHRGGTYRFDGGLATLDCLKITGTGNTLNLSNAVGRVTMAGYGRYVFWVTGACNTINDPYLLANGYIAAGHCYHYRIQSDCTFNRPVIASGLDNNNRHYGIRFDVSGGGTVNDAVVTNLVTTAGGQIYPVITNGASGASVLDGITIENMSASNGVFGIFWNGTGAGDVLAVRRAHISNINVGVGTAYAGYGLTGKGINIEDFVCIGPGTSGIRVSSAAAFVGNENRIVNGVLYGWTSHGIEAVCNFAGSAPTVENVIARDGTANGFTSTGAFDPDSDNNLAYGNGTDYNGWTKGASDLENVRPMHTDAAGGDFTLLAGSPCIDAGATIVGRSTDFAGDPISGSGTDIGPYEYQWDFPRYDEGYALLPSLYKEATYFVHMIQALSGKITPKNSVEELEVVGQALAADLWIANATGIQLDVLGRILGRLRGGMADEEYRHWLYLQAAINTSQGLAEQVIQIMVQWFAPDWVQILEQYPQTGGAEQTAKFYACVKTAGTIPPNITDLIQQIAAGGVSMWFTSPTSLTPFGFSDDSLADGFDEVDLFHVPEGNGGAYTELYPHDGET